VPGCRTGYASQKNETEKIKSISLFKPPAVIFFNCFYRQFNLYSITINYTFNIKLFSRLKYNIYMYIICKKTIAIYRNQCYIYIFILFVTGDN